MYFIPARKFQPVCSIKCAIERNREKRQKEIKKQENKERKEGRESLMSHGDWLQLLQKVFNTYIRKRDEGQPCISCETTANVRYDAGHFWPTTYGFLRFHEDNVHRQCSNNCNLKKSGNHGEYRIGLIKKIGIDRVEWLDNNRHETVKLSIPEIKEKIQEYRTKTKNLTKKS